MNVPKYHASKEFDICFDILERLSAANGTEKCVCIHMLDEYLTDIQRVMSVMEERIKEMSKEHPIPLKIDFKGENQNGTKNCSEGRY